jgi:hypothetical protein
MSLCDVLSNILNVILDNILKKNRIYYNRLVAMILVNRYLNKFMRTNFDYYIIRIYNYHKIRYRCIPK